MALTNAAIRNAKPGVKPVKLFDERGLFLLVTPAGDKWWRFRFRFDGKGKLLSLGVYPEVGLKDARNRRDEAWKLLAEGTDPSEHRKTQKTAKQDRAEIHARITRQGPCVHCHSVRLENGLPCPMMGTARDSLGGLPAPLARPRLKFGRDAGPVGPVADREAGANPGRSAPAFAARLKRQHPPNRGNFGPAWPP